MHAHPAGLEEFAVAGPFTLLVLHDVVVVIPLNVAWKLLIVMRSFSSAYRFAFSIFPIIPLSMLS
jgi:hypothetical protein